MPVKGGQFTVQELDFIGFCADTGNAVRAAELAGYSRPDIAATRLSYRPEVQAAIRAKVSARVAVEGAPAALACLISIVRDENAPKAPRVQASKVLLDLDREQSGAAGSGGALSEMSRAQLDEAREKAIAYIRSLDAPPVLELSPEPVDTGAAVGHSGAIESPGLFD